MKHGPEILFDYANMDTQGASYLTDDELMERITWCSLLENGAGWGNVAEALKRFDALREKKK